MKKNRNKASLADLEKSIVAIADWPEPGVTFRDITPLLENPELFRAAIDRLAEKCADKRIDKVVGLDARGFIFASALAYKLGAGLVLARKKGKLPRETVARGYGLEYGKAVLEIHKDSIKEGEKILIVDDVLATGGTMAAAAGIIKELKGDIVGILCLIELPALNGREKLEAYEVKSLFEF